MRSIGTAPGENSIFDGTVARNIFTLTVSGLYDVTYYCRVRAIDAAGNTGNWSPSSSGVTVVLPPMIDQSIRTNLFSNDRRPGWHDGGSRLRGLNFGPLGVNRRSGYKQRERS